MKAVPLTLLRESEKGRTFQGSDFKLVYRFKGSVSGDNSENAREIIYLIAGKAEITVNAETQIVSAPASITIPEMTSHKIIAITDLTLILFD